ncbi:MAG: hypothetical protein CVV27_07995 [Candidatus Melainabacteria bacterium HGW-Melainabacteria-1]|nr:MAG: hypothetical protein CVV27_07995 [Candidatus Melainabacteria bacterium HGW-Melainabacteria-1]
MLGFLQAVPAIAETPQALRHVYVSPGLPVAYQQLFHVTMAQHPLWQIALAPADRQILRLQEFKLQTRQPFYWTRTRLDERSLELDATVSMEIWRGPDLRWQRTLSVQRKLRLMGPELRGTGIARLSPLAELPAGALSAQTGPDREIFSALQQDLLAEVAHQLLRDYQLHHMRE